MKMHYYILEWNEEKKMFQPIWSAFFPKGLPKRLPGQRFAVSHYSIDKRINGKELPKCRFGGRVLKGESK